jgi:hexosaminidase
MVTADMVVSFGSPVVRTVMFALVSASLACGRRTPVTTTPVPAADPSRVAHAIVPVPASVQMIPTDTFTVDSTTQVVVGPGGNAEAQRVAAYLAYLLAGPLGPAPRTLNAGEAPPPRSVVVMLDATESALGLEGYELAVTRDAVTLTAAQPNGLFYGVQTIRQLLPWSIEHRGAINRRLRIPGARITDTPRFAWRGAMLDVSRHFIGAEDVKRYIDLMSLYKLNRLHLHLSDDQGWRIVIGSRPNLTEHGGSTQVGGGPGGYFTQAQFRDIVAYATSRFITIVPEIDMPGHTNAALASYAELNCDGVAPPLYTGIRVGFSTLCVTKEDTYVFVNDVVREIAGMLPTPYFHMGGDEVEKLTPDQYRRFVERVEKIIHSHGKQMIGWGEISPANISPATIVQHWRRDSSALHIARGGKVIMSPGPKTYLDMKYDSTTVLGLRWAGLIEVRDAYDWNPGALLPEVPDSAVLGVEAPLWAETIVKLQDYEFMAFPRLVAISEVGWSSTANHGWDSFRLRLARHGPRLSALGVNFYRSPQVPWVQ